MQKKKQAGRKKSESSPLKFLSENQGLSARALAIHQAFRDRIASATAQSKEIDSQLSFMAQSVIRALTAERMSLRDLSRRLELSPTYLCHVNQGKTACSWLLYLKLCDLLTLEMKADPPSGI